MNFELFEKYEPAIRSYQGDPQTPSLRMYRNGEFEAFYAPFEWVNPTAKIVFVGITPGKTQAHNALAEAQRALAAGVPALETLRCAKHVGAFSGPMRPKLIALLDRINLHQWLGVPSCGALFGEAAELLQTTSLLQFPVFRNGGNYSGTPDPIRDPMLRLQMRQHFGAMAKEMPNAIFLPLGTAVSKGVKWLAGEGYLKKEQVFHGLPHPSPANSERIAYFLGEKARADLSTKTSASKLDAAREELLRAVAALP